jgi:tripartite-type tricarboxylate transporter receptor subunit TctC
MTHDVVRTTLHILSAACFAFATHAMGQVFPTKPVKLLVPYVPGGLVDLVGRNVAQRLSDVFRQPVVVENRPGAVGAIAIASMKQLPADGYTLIVMEPAVVITPIVQPKTTYRVNRDLQVVSIVGATPLVLIVNASLPAKDLKELVSLARSKPGALNYSSAGIGTTLHMAGEMLKAQAGVDIIHVPYKGGSAALADLLAGQIQMTFLASTIVSQYLKDGRVRAIASTGLKRSPVLPDVPTFAESGFPNYEVSVWVGLFASKGVPEDTLARLNQATREIVKREEFRAALEKTDIEPLGNSVEDAQALLDREESKWTEIVRSNNVKPD